MNEGEPHAQPNSIDSLISDLSFAGRNPISWWGRDNERDRECRAIDRAAHQGLVGVVGLSQGRGPGMSLLLVGIFFIFIFKKN